MATTAETMVTVLETFLASNAGVVEVTVDGQRVKWDRAQALRELQYWQRRVQEEQGKRPRLSTINLGNAW